MEKALPRYSVEREKVIMFDIPVAIIIFNRPSFVKKMYNVLQKVKPKDLYIISDEARENIAGEKENVLCSRLIAENPQWECNTHLLYAEKNMGCDVRIKSGLDWLFSVVEYAIVLEDDCIPDESFFNFCAELLERYRYNDRIQYIAGSNQIKTYPIKDTSYIFTYEAWTWGWASWARAWNSQKNIMSDYGNTKKELLSIRFLSLSEKMSKLRAYKQYIRNGIYPWDINFTWDALLKEKLSIVPKTNLVNHIGFTEEATHVKEPFAGYDGTTIAMQFPLVHPQVISEKKGYHLKAYNWRREPFFHKLLDINFYKRQIKKIWKR